MQADLRKEWESRLADYRTSGLTAQAWCSRTGFTMNQLRYWQRKSRQSEPGGKWASVTVIEDLPAGALPPSKPSGGVTIRMGSATIDVSPGVDRELLAQVLRVVATC